MTLRRHPISIPAFLAAFALLGASGCAPIKLPAIDPTGKSIFLPQGSYTTFVAPSPAPGCLEPAYQEPPPVPPCPPEPPPNCGTATPLPPSAPAPAPTPLASEPAVQGSLLHPEREGQILLTPARIMAPVGSEVVLVSGLYGARREFVARQPLEWTLSGDSVGQIVSTADDENCAADLFRNASVRKTGNRAVTQTSTSTMVLTRGTPNRGDDVTLLRGQSWVTVSSPTAGTTYVTVMAPQAYNWDQRRQTAAIHWVDVQWRVPPPAIVQASQPHLLSTEVQRTSGKPLPGWIVRYELSESAGPGLDAQGRSILEAVTDEAGRASVNLVPANRSGSCQVEVKIIRPSNPDDDLPRMVVGRGWTSVNWSAADPQVTLTGPESASIGATITYHAVFSNAGDLPARDVVASMVVPSNMTFLQSDPPAKILGSKLSWEFGDLAPREARTVVIHCRPEQNANTRLCVRVASGVSLAAQPLSAEACIETRVFSPSLALRVNGPPTARVGEQATFEIQVTNTGAEPLQDVVIRDRLPPGLEHPTEKGSLLEQTLAGPLAPGATNTLPVPLLVRQAGRLCHTVEVTARGGHTAVSNVCLDALDQPTPASAPASSPRPALEARIDGPQQGRIGDQLTYVLQVQNTGNVPLTGLRVMVTYEPSFYPKEASKEFDLSALPRGQLIWNVASLAPGEILRREAKFECLRQSPAAWTRLFVETAENVGLNRETTTEIVPAPRSTPAPVAPPATAPPAAPAPQAEPPPPQVTGKLKVSVGDSQDPLALNGKTTYIIVIENGMNVSDRNVAVTLQLPPGLNFVDLRGPVTARGMSNDRRTIQLTPVAEIRPGEALPALYVDVTGARIGKHVFKVRVDSYRSGQPIEVEEDTTVNISG